MLFTLLLAEELLSFVTFGPCTSLALSASLDDGVVLRAIFPLRCLLNFLSGRLTIYLARDFASLACLTSAVVNFDALESTACNEE